MAINTADDRLRAAGLLHAGEVACVALPILAALNSRLESLQSLTPNLTGTIQALRYVAALTEQPARSAPSTTQATPLVSWFGGANFVQWLATYLPNGVPQDRKELWLDILALRWLYSAALRNFGDQLGFNFRDSIESPDREVRRLSKAKLPHSALELGYAEWLMAISERSPESGLPRLAKSLHQIIELSLQTSPSPAHRPLPRLSERQLLRSHWHHFRPAQHHKLIKLLNRELGADSGSIVTEVEMKFPVNHEPISREAMEDAYEAYRTRHRNEAGLLALSIQTSQPIQTLLTWRVHAGNEPSHESNSFQHFSTLSKKSGKWYAKAKWVKYYDGPTKLTGAIELPHEVRSWLSNLHPGWGAPTLGDILPISPTPWDSRAYNYLAAELGCSRNRAEVLCRDLVSQLVYEKTSNSALVSFWRDDTSKKADRTERLALVHYLQPTGKRAAEEITSAISEALGTRLYDPSEVPVLIRKVTDEEDSTSLKDILAALERDHQTASGTFARHNALARLTLFICLVATGHRRSLTPFPFPWDFNPTEKLVFICDKLVTGSEARFVPLSNTALTSLQRYVKGLKLLSRQLQGPTRAYVEQTISFLSFEDEPPHTSKLTEFDPTSGVFFLLDRDGNISPKPLSTGALDRHIEHLTLSSWTTGKLRAILAQHLWEEGCSGRMIQAFLGHQPEMHVHGPASTWSVDHVAKTISPIIDSLFINELKQQAPPSEDWCPSSCFPAFTTTSNHTHADGVTLGYEGRKREKAWLEYRAQAVLRQEISERLLASETDPTATEELLTKDDQKRIFERLTTELSHDPVAMKGVSAILEAKLSKSVPPTRASASDWGRATPGPVEIGFSRLLRGAHVLRSIWERSVGLPIGNPEFDTVEALAHLAISLVCFDAILAKENLGSLVRAAANGDFETYQGEITLRASVVTATHDYEFSVRPGSVSTALALGIAKRSEDSAFDWSEVALRVQTILHKLLCLGSPQKWSIARLCLVFRPYWLIRLPGAMYSVSIGEFKGPAADATSEAMLHGKRPPPPPAKPLPLVDPARAVEHEQQEALKGLKLLFRNARGELEKGEQRRRVQRAKLRASVRAELNDDMQRWSSSSQIVYLLLTFIDWLLDNGGRRVKSLAPRSIEKYFSLVAEVLIREAWSIDFESCDAETLKNLFDSVAQQLDQDQGRTALGYFAAHLQDSVDTPYFGARWSNPRSPIRIRTSLVLPQHIDRALTLLAKQADPLSRQASTLIATCAGYGLRRLEAFGLAAHQFDAHQNHHLSITRTLVADLKTKWSRRVIASPLLAGPAAERLTQEVQLARTSPREVQYLFEADTRDYRINSVSKISALATTALRVATGNPSIVPHHLRHSFGTVLGIAVLAGPKSDSPLSRLATRLVGTGYAKVASSVLNHPKDWPFGIDAVANVLGHADVGMFLNTYFHASHWVISDRCAQWQPRQVQQARLGNIFDVDRTTLSKLQTRLKTSSSKAEISLDEMVKEIARRHEDPTTDRQEGLDQSRAQFSNQWSHVFRALLYRLDNDLTLDEMWAYAGAHLSFSPDRIQAISHRYTQFVRETGFDDFEPASSDLIDAVASHRNGVGRGQLERESFTSTVQHWANAAPENRSALEELLRIWVDRVDPIAPRIVCQNMGELQRTITTLESLGATTAHLSFELHGDQLDPWLVKAQEMVSIDSHASVRASRGSARVKVPEVSIAVKQVPGSPVPDGRDFHRALVGVYLAMPGE